jgi:hypothetical protein
MQSQSRNERRENEEQALITTQVKGECRNSVGYLVTNLFISRPGEIMVTGRVMQAFITNLIL